MRCRACITQSLWYYFIQNYGNEIPLLDSTWYAMHSYDYDSRRIRAHREAREAMVAQKKGEADRFYFLI